MNIEVSEEQRGINLLLVDDRPDGLIAMEAVLQDPHYTLFKASSGPESLSLAFDNDFAAIILDVQMPGMDGFETAHLLRRRSRSAHTPIIFVTAISKEIQYVQKGYAAGGVDYLTKPFDPDILRSKVAVFADLYSKNRQLREQAERLAHSEERIRLLVESARDIIITTAVDGTLTSLSPAFESILGWEKQEWLGRSFQPLVHAEDLGSVVQGFHRVLRGQEIDIFEARFLSSGSTYVPLESSARPLIQNGKVIGVLHIARDISVRKQMEHERRRRSELERSNRELEEFASICSHDLQEPLRQITSFTQLIKKRYSALLPGESNEYFDFIVTGTRRMSQLVNDLLNYSKLGAPDLQVAPMPMQEALDEAVKLLEPAIRKTHAAIKWSEMPEVIGNHGKLVQVFQNLLNNAIKFRGEKTPEIHIEAACEEGRCRFSVRDNGIGFDMSYADRIFQIFRRLHKQTDYPGTGVGLASCKKIIERHGGTIWVDSKSGEGTVFYFTIPLASARAPAPEGFVGETLTAQDHLAAHGVLAH